MRVNFISNRNKYLQKLVKDKDVLHLGCLDYGRDSKTDFHEILSLSAKRLLGVDIDKELVKKYKNQYDVILGDVQKKLPIKEKFDFVIAGEIIEHLTNFGAMLENCKNYLNKNGKLIISTPNAYNYRNILRQFFLNHVIQDKEHVCIFDKETIIYSLKRHGYKLSLFSYLQIKPVNKLHRLIDFVFCFLKKSFAPGILVIAVNGGTGEKKRKPSKNKKI